MAQDDVKSIDQLNEEADIAADYLEGLLDIADYEGDIEMACVMTAPPCKSLLMTILTSNILLAVMVKSLMLCSN